MDNGDDPRKRDDPQLPKLPMPQFEPAHPHEPVIDRPVRGLINADLRAEAGRLYTYGYPVGEISRRLGRPSREIRRWITEALADYVLTAESANVIRQRQFVQIETLTRRVFEIIEAAGMDELGLKGIDRMIKLLQHEAAIGGLDKDISRAGGVDPIDGELAAMLEAAQARVQEAEEQINNGGSAVG